MGMGQNWVPHFLRGWLILNIYIYIYTYIYICIYNDIHILKINGYIILKHRLESVVPRVLNSDQSPLSSDHSPITIPFHSHSIP